MTAQRALIVFVLMLVLLTVLSGCVAPPKGNPAQTISSSVGTTGGSKGGTQAVTAATTAAGVTGFVTPATPFPVTTTPKPLTNYTVLPQVTVKAIEYTAIYYETIPFKQNATAVSYTLTMPPMIIEMCFKPNMTTRTIWYEDKNGDGVTQKVTTISPAAWFDMKVRDPVTGNVVAEEGYARSYSVDTAKKLTIRSAGTYLIEFSGNDLSAEIQIRVPNTMEQKGMAVRDLSCSVTMLQ
jgi:hypothetical protein